MKIVLALTLLALITLGTAALHDRSFQNLRGSTPSFLTDNLLRTIRIDNMKGTSHLYDHQVKVVLTRDNFDFENTHPEGHDLYFKDNQGNILSNWIESYDPIRQHALIWVKVPTIPPQIVSSIQLYQGEVDPTRSSGDNTFDFFDDFDVLPSAWVEQGPVLTPSQPWEGNMVRDPTVLFQDNQYHLWYWNAGADIGYATSSDGVNWDKYESNPVFTNALRPSVVFKDNIYYLFYAETDEHAIRLATSSSPTGPFEDHGVVVGPSQDWENGLIRGPSVWYDTDEQVFKLWYSASEVSPNGVPWTEPAAIGYATSQDGYNWTKYENNPVMSGIGDGSWLSKAIETLRVYKLNETYYGFYHAADYWGVSRIGLTLSENGYEWNPQPEDLIVDLGGYGDFDSDFLYTTAPMYNNGWMFWHNGRNNDDPNPEVIGFVKLETNVSQLNTTKWAKSRRVTVNVENSTASFKMFPPSSLAFDQHDYFIWSAQQFQDGVLEAQIQMPNGYYDQYSLVAIGQRFNGTYHNILIEGNPAYYGDMSWYELFAADGTVLSDMVRAGRWVNATEDTFSPDSQQPINRNQWYTLSLEVFGENISGFIDYQQIYKGQDNSLTQQGSLLLRILETDCIVDWVRFRKSGAGDLNVTVEESIISI